MPQFRCGAESRKKADRAEVQVAEVPISLSLLDASDVRIHERPNPNLVPLSSADLHERARETRTPNGPRGHRLCSAGKLFPMDRGLRQGARADGRAVEN